MSILNNAYTAEKYYEYDSYGKAEEKGATDFINENTFTGAIAEGDGIYYMNARFYDANTGRFLSQDTYKGNAYEPWSQNLYSYCGNNPVNYVDPTGHNGVRVNNRFGLRKATKDKITISILVAQPRIGKRNAIKGIKQDVGHTFIRLDMGNGEVDYWGFYPDGALSTNQIINGEDIEGIIHDDSTHKWNIGLVFEIDEAQAAEIKKYAGEYLKKTNIILLLIIVQHLRLEHLICLD